MNPRYLSKSRFQLALSCPSKLYYEGKPDYPNRSLEDSFLASLAEGGFQVGALARAQYPDGILVDAAGNAEAIRQTLDLMRHDKVTLFEAAFAHGSLLARVDILVKRGKTIELIEVKAKSYHPGQDSFYNKDGSLAAGWKPYLHDVAFQARVLRLALPGMDIQPFLMLADKSAVCPRDGLNQMFRIQKDAQGRGSVVVSRDLTPDFLTPSMLVRVPVEAACDRIYASGLALEGSVLPYHDYVDALADYQRRDERIDSPLGAVCGGCEFDATEAELAQGKKSGFRECWKAALGWTDADFSDQTVLEIWNYRKKDALLAAGQAKLSQVRPDDITIKTDSRPGITASQRQWLQVDKAQRGDSQPWLDRDGLRAEMDSWQFPLHFIDFETSMVAIPFNKGRHPYEGIAFQFSHHTVEADGTVRHAGQYLNTRPGYFPNYDFIRELMRQLSQDQGTIFRYAPHENSFLNIIHQQLLDEPVPVPDQAQLCAFIRSISQSTGSSALQWTGPRNMVDMLELVKRHYYHPLTRGSNSIKQVLPAILHSSPWLRARYEQPVYGAQNGIPSLNFKDWAWVRTGADGQVLDPYKLLPPMFSDESARDNALLSASDEIRDGAAALTAYAKMQFGEMGAYERGQLEGALLKYCELDTLAMVMIYEAWREMVS